MSPEVPMELLWGLEPLYSGTRLGEMDMFSLEKAPRRPQSP